MPMKMMCGVLERVPGTAMESCLRAALCGVVVGWPDVVCVESDLMASALGVAERRGFEQAMATATRTPSATHTPREPPAPAAAVAAVAAAPAPAPTTERKAQGTMLL
eukprot:3207316-Rhodomonas_salina.2